MMNDADSLSMTPPLSPAEFILEEIVPSPPQLPQLEDEERNQMFNCVGDVKADYWRSGFLNRLFSEGDIQGIGAVCNNNATLFGYEWSDLGEATTSIDKLFLILRQEASQLQTEAVKCRLSFLQDSCINGEGIRHHICAFLDLILQMIQSGKLTAVYVASVLQELHTLILHIGRLSDLPNHIVQVSWTGNKTSLAYHCFHTHLDIYWRSLAILHAVKTKYPDIESTGRWCMTPDHDIEPSLYDQLLHLILWELVYLAFTKYAVSRGDYLKVSMFTCPCVREMWLLTLKLTQWRCNNCTGESFWVSVHHVFKMVLEMDSMEQLMEIEDCRVILNPPEGFRTDDPAGLCIWIMYNIAPLYTEKTPAHILRSDDGKAVSNYHDLQSLLKKILVMPGLTETILRQHVKLVLLMTSNWEPNIGILITLWDFFYKRLNQNETFQGSSSKLEGLACVDHNVVGLYDRCKLWTCGHAGNLDKDTSYHLFLRLLSEHLGKLYSSGSTQEWKQMKGRIYSKFHAKRVQELMEAGLYNLTSLFITLGMTADLEDVASKLVNFYDMLDIASLSFSRRSVVWRGVLTLMLVYVHRDLDIGFLADRMSVTFEAAVGDFKVAGLDTRHHLWKLILTYMEGVQEIMETSQCLHLSEYKLIGPCMKTLLSVCSEHELRTCLSSLHSIIQKFRQVKCETRGETSVTVTLQHADFNSTLWKNVYSFITEHAQTLTPPTVIGDIAASFCLLSLVTPPNDDSTMIDVFQYFSTSDKVNVRVTCRFLSHLLSNNDVMDHLQHKLENYESFLVCTWFRCSLLIPEPSQLAEITRPILQLSEVRSIYQTAEMDSVNDADMASVNFLKAIERAHSKLQTWHEKMSFQKQVTRYFTDVPKHVSPVVKALSPGDVVNNVYRMTGFLVKYCAKLLYVRQDVIIPSLLSCLIVPHNVLHPDKPLSHVFLTAIREHLHLFMQGLGKLAYDRDPYIQRRLKDIVAVYLPKFTLKSSVSMATAVHPVVACLRGSFIQLPSTESVKFRQYIIQLVNNNYIIVRNMKINAGHSVGFSFLYEVVQRTTSSEVKARDLPIMLLSCMDYLLLLANNDTTWNLVLAILQELTDAYSSHTDSVPISELSGICGRFVSNNFKFSSTGVIKVMEKLAVMLPRVVSSVVDKLSDNVREIERKRGVGVDQKLRGQYFQVLKLLGETGEMEIQKLKSQTGIS